MRLLAKILYLIGKGESLYKKQPINTTICLPLAMYNAFVYKELIPPSMFKLKRLCKWTQSGTLLNTHNEYLINKLGLVSTIHSNVILKKGGILLIDNNTSEDVYDVHAVLCLPSKRRNNTYINISSNNEIIETFNEKIIFKHLPKFGEGFKGYYFE